MPSYVSLSELEQIFQEQYDDVFSKILLLDENQFMNVLEKQIILHLCIIEKQPIFSDLSHISQKFIQKYYEDKEKVYKLYKFIKKSNINDLEYLDRLNCYLHCPHCSDAFHICGLKLILCGDYVFCLSCKKVYNENQVKMYCNHCGEDYYTKLREITDDELENYFPVSCENYHCDVEKEEKIHCPKCHDDLYADISKFNKSVNKKNKKKIEEIFCLKCNISYKVNDINFHCSKCNEIFKSDVKLYNEFNYGKNNILCLVHTLLKKKYALPKETTEQKCKCDLSNVKKYKHINCNGNLLEGLRNGKKVIVCDECYTIINYNNFNWTCPFCYKTFKSSEVSIECSETSSLNITEKEKKNITKNPAAQKKISQNKNLLTPQNQNTKNKLNSLNNESKNKMSNVKLNNSNNENKKHVIKNNSKQKENVNSHFNKTNSNIGQYIKNNVKSSIRKISNNTISNDNDILVNISNNKGNNTKNTSINLNSNQKNSKPTKLKNSKELSISNIFEAKLKSERCDFNNSKNSLASPENSRNLQNKKKMSYIHIHNITNEKTKNNKKENKSISKNKNENILKIDLDSSQSAMSPAKSYINIHQIFNAKKGNNSKPKENSQKLKNKKMPSSKKDENKKVNDNNIKCCKEVNNTKNITKVNPNKITESNNITKVNNTLENNEVNTKKEKEQIIKNNNKNAPSKKNDDDNNNNNNNEIKNINEEKQNEKEKEKNEQKEKNQERDKDKEKDKEKISLSTIDEKSDNKEVSSCIKRYNSNNSLNIKKTEVNLEIFNTKNTTKENSNNNKENTKKTKENTITVNNTIQFSFSPIIKEKKLEPENEKKHIELKEDRNSNIVIEKCLEDQFVSVSKEKKEQKNEKKEKNENDKDANSENNNNFIKENINKNSSEKNIQKINNSNNQQKIDTSCNISSKGYQFNSENYNIVQLLGEGTFGKIFLVEDPDTNEKYALKKISVSDIEELTENQREFELVMKLTDENPNINIVKILGIQVKKLDKFNLVMYVLMEAAQCDWENEIKNRNQYQAFYTEEELMKILINLIQTFATLQNLGICHRDVKPQNILCFGKDSYKISDFGEAKKKKKKTINGSLMYDFEADTSKQTVRGTELYMSPILFQALHDCPEVDLEYNAYKSDVFSLGLCMLLASTLGFDALYDIRELYDMNKLIYIVDKYLNGRYSKKYIEILTHMLEIKEKYRPDFIELESWINLNYYQEQEQDQEQEQEQEQEHEESKEECKEEKKEEKEK